MQCSRQKFFSSPNASETPAERNVETLAEGELAAGTKTSKYTNARDLEELAWLPPLATV
jgi:hypothetical protein